MKIIPVSGRQAVYTSNVYMVQGDFKRVEDLNTLVDVGNDPTLVDVLFDMNAGVGKKKVEQVVLTHDHSDHSGILPLIRKVFNPVVFAFSPYLDGVDRILKHGDVLRMGDRYFDVLHITGHSSDSVCLYNKSDGVLFAGDTPVIIRSEGGVYDEDFHSAIADLCTKTIQTIYFGHGEPMTDDIQNQLRQSLAIIRKNVVRT